MDSLTSMKIQQSLEQEFGVFLPPGQIRSLTFTCLSDMAANKQEEQSSQALSVDDGPIEGLQLLLHVTGDEASAAQPVVHLPSAAGAEPDTADDVKAGPLLFMLTGAEGVACILEPLAKNLKYQIVCLQLNYRDIGQTIQDIAQSLVPVCLAHLLNNPFTDPVNLQHFYRISELCRN
ncbi:hypothetical protein B7P43_G18126 [Cryptotermes secundus]|uniref:Carrier domain-containing protein n=2 Tax=Cryptotermes secundus TaxID=105785 RepID=A0A2J7PGI0_9NEOP|nr:hypothetical protein B7P43_G18126 [Cryptotermes secundus]